MKIDLFMRVYISSGVTSFNDSVTNSYVEANFHKRGRYQTLFLVLLIMLAIFCSKFNLDFQLWGSIFCFIYIILSVSFLYRTITFNKPRGGVPFYTELPLSKRVNSTGIVDLIFLIFPLMELTQ